MRKSKNKEHFADLLTEKLANSEWKVLHAQDDVNVMVVQTAVSCAETLSTTLIWNDTGLLVLLLYHTKLDAYDIFMQTDTYENNQRVYDIKGSRTIRNRSSGKSTRLQRNVWLQYNI